MFPVPYSLVDVFWAWQPSTMRKYLVESPCWRFGTWCNLVMVLIKMINLTMVMMMFSLLLLLHWPRRIMKDIRQLDKLLSPLFHCLFMASFMFMITIIVTIMKKENKFSLSANIIFTITKDNIGACLYSGPPRFPFVFFTQFCHFDVFAAEKFCSWQNQAFEIIFLSGMFFSTF